MFNSLVKRSFRKLGFNLQRFNPDHSVEARLNAMLAKHKIDLVFDVGANVGQFARSIREAGYCGQIVSFEPQSLPWAQLVEASKSDPLWEAAPRTAIGSEDGEIDLHIAGNTYSSSVLDMLSTHVAAAPDSAYVGSETAPIRRLDTIGAGYMKPHSNLLIKIDTQGFEDRVLNGAPTILKRTAGLHLELAIVPLYKDQCDYQEMLDRVREQGFELWSIEPNFVDPESGRTLSLDATFFRESLSLKQS
jgi:FkbM family methyltransferase